MDGHISLAKKGLRQTGAFANPATRFSAVYLCSFGLELFLQFGHDCPISTSLRKQFPINFLVSNPDDSGWYALSGSRRRSILIRR